MKKYRITLYPSDFQTVVTNEQNWATPTENTKQRKKQQFCSCLCVCLCSEINLSRTKRNASQFTRRWWWWWCVVMYITICTKIPIYSLFMRFDVNSRKLVRNCSSININSNSLVVSLLFIHLPASRARSLPNNSLYSIHASQFEMKVFSAW